MRLNCNKFFIVKAGNNPEDYEDAYKIDLKYCCFAIADGATETSFAGTWAQILANSFNGFELSIPEVISKLQPEQIHEKMEKWLEPLQKEWHDSIDWQKLSWSTEEKALRGAFSTLLGIEFLNLDSANIAYNAVAIGDSCLFHVRGEKLLRTFPIERAKEFNNTPPLLSSLPEANREIGKEVFYYFGDVNEYDLFLMATDALGHWFLSQYEAGAKPWEILMEIPSPERFEDFVTQLRQNGTIRNDDTTLIIIGAEPLVSEVH